MKCKLFKQHNIPGVGAIWDTTIYTAFFLSLTNMVFLGITAWAVYIKDFASKYLPWLNLWLFLTLVWLVLFGLGIITYKFIIPSYYAFRERQYSQHGDNEQLKTLEKKLDVLTDKVNDCLLRR